VGLIEAVGSGNVEHDYGCSVIVLHWQVVWRLFALVQNPLSISCDSPDTFFSPMSVDRMIPLRLEGRGARVIGGRRYAQMP